MDIALIGPGYGHNIIPYLKFLNGQKKHSVDFYYHHKDSYSQEYTNLNFLSITRNLLSLFFNVRKYNVIWLMGGGRLLYIIALVRFFIRKDCKLVISPYGEQLPRETTEKNIKGWLTLKALSCFTHIHCGWYGIADLLHSKLKSKILIHVMGLNKDFYEVSPNPDTGIIELMGYISNNEYNFYYPKSFLRVSRHDLVIEAVRILKEDKNLPPFKVYFLGGNERDNQRYNELLEQVSSYKLQSDIIFLTKTKFYKTEDLNLVWQKIDCGLQIAQWDGLSTTIFEPLINEKELIISDIPPYKYLKGFFGFDFNLTPVNASDIAQEMKFKILDINAKSKEEKGAIKAAIKGKYSFENNIEKLLLRFEEDN